jgi:hypothetical protein
VFLTVRKFEISNWKNKTLFQMSRQMGSEKENSPVLRIKGADRGVAFRGGFWFVLWKEFLPDVGKRLPQSAVTQSVGLDFLVWILLMLRRVRLLCSAKADFCSWDSLTWPCYSLALYSVERKLYSLPHSQGTIYTTDGFWPDYISRDGRKIISHCYYSHWKKLLIYIFINT